MNLPQKLQPNLIQSQKYLQAKKSCSLLLSVHDELIKENAEVEPLLASPSSVQVRSYLSELPTSRTGASTKIVSLHWLNLSEPISLLHLQVLKASAYLPWLDMW